MTQAFRDISNPCAKLSLLKCFLLHAVKRLWSVVTTGQVLASVTALPTVT